MVVEHQDFGKFALRPHRMHFEIAELTAERDVLRGRQMLVAQHDDLVLDQRGFEGVQRRRRQWLSEIDTGDFRAELDAQALDLKWRRRRRQAPVRARR